MNSHELEYKVFQQIRNQVNEQFQPPESRKGGWGVLGQVDILVGRQVRWPILQEQRRQAVELSAHTPMDSRTLEHEIFNLATRRSIEQAEKQVLEECGVEVWQRVDLGRRTGVGWQVWGQLIWPPLEELKEQLADEQ